MPGEGDFQGSPAEDQSVMELSQDMVVAELSFNSHAILVTIGGARPRTEPCHIAEALCREFNINVDELRVSEHYPEDFFVYFIEPAVKEAAVDKEHLAHHGREFLILPWCAERHSEGGGQKGMRRRRREAAASRR